MRGLIERVVLHPTGHGYEVELVGDLARMLEAGLSADNKKAASLGETARSVKMVAGARYGTYLTPQKRITLKRTA